MSDVVEVLEQDVQVEEFKADAERHSRIFYTMGDQGQAMVGGRIGSTDYGKDKDAKALFFEANDGATASLGLAKTGKLWDTYQTTRPIFEAGFTNVEWLKPTRKGAGMIALFSHPDLKLDDLITWDKDMYEGIKDSRLRLSIMATVDARMGKSFQYTSGFFRVICTNGLVSSYLGLGDFRSNHKNFTTESLHQYASSVIERFHKWGNPPSFSSKVLDYPIKVLRQFADDEDAEWKVPHFVAEPMNSLQRALPGWGLPELSHQFDVLATKENQMTILDLINGLTNLNIGRETTTIYKKLGLLTRATMTLIELGSWKNDIPLPNFRLN